MIPLQISQMIIEAHNEELTECLRGIQLARESTKSVPIHFVLNSRSTGGRKVRDALLDLTLSEPRVYPYYENSPSYVTAVDVELGLCALQNALPRLATKLEGIIRSQIPLMPKHAFWELTIKVYFPQLSLSSVDR
jgi:hypothetical protein